MGRLADLKQKCSGGVSSTCTQAEYDEFVNLSHENSAASWFDRIMGGVTGIGGIVTGAIGGGGGGTTGNGGNGGGGGTTTNSNTMLYWVLGIVAVVVIVILVFALRGRRGKVAPTATA